MRSDVQAIFKETPHDKQVMMFSATMAKEIRTVCKKFMNKVRPYADSARSACYTALHDLSLLATAASASAAAVLDMPGCHRCALQQWQAEQLQQQQLSLWQLPLAACSAVVAG
jgi:hypothetical protein